MNKIEKISLIYQEKKVTAYRLTVASHIAIDEKTAWQRVKTSALLKFITKGKVTFKPIGGSFPKIWKEGSRVQTKMYLYGFLPFGGVHTLDFKQINEEQKILATHEFDAVCKVWNHTILIEKADENSIFYTDEIVIYAGWLSKIVVWWAKHFYIHRQKRWKKVR
ncbi:hypothetical protein CAPN001_19830 [Capnocytophaga stomatis]|uniref:hypothetical protein n=1 Tax=Capnocytophaga stomatis TaxID=1848904 RepID=UPI001A374FF1|nr:hypothetical protein [Capnocytophaga stomatis]GIJ97414.1 hypothetical protein CAPN001_19830 [Capnocytophaga stomatis]